MRSYARRKTSEKQSLNVADIVKQALSVFKASGRFKGEVVEECGGTFPVLADSMEIELAVLNLLRNAADALNDAQVTDPTIRLTMRREANEVQISVADNGPVMAEDAVLQLGTPLQTTKANGLGLGLVLVRTIVENHGGRLVLEAGSGGGLTATIRLPLEKQRDEG